MATPIIGRPGTKFTNTSYGTDADELFLKVFAGEIVTTFEEMNVMMPLHRVRTISSGKSASFPLAGVASAQYHTPGESLLSMGAVGGYAGTTSGSSTASTMTVGVEAFSGTAKYGTRFKHSEKIISIDDFLVASTFVADIDQMKNHYDVRSIYSTELGRALSYTADKNLIRSVIAGARSTTDRFGGSSAQYLGAQIDLGDATITAEELVAGLFSVAQKMDEKNVPQEGRVAVLTPTMYYRLVNGEGTKIAINKDWGGNGSISKGTIVEIAGIRILKSNHIPQVSETSTAVAPFQDVGIKNDIFGSSGIGYGGADFANTQGIAFQTEGIATVKLQDISVMTDYITERLGTLMLAKYAMGHDVLRHECCYEIMY
jgi:hypothetical protein